MNFFVPQHWVVGFYHCLACERLIQAEFIAIPFEFSSSPQPFVVEDFVGWTDYSSGSNETSSPVQFRKVIKTTYYIKKNK